MFDELTQMYDDAENVIEKGIAAAAVLQAAGFDLFIAEPQAAQLYDIGEDD